MSRHPITSLRLDAGGHQHLKHILKVPPHLIEGTAPSKLAPLHQGFDTPNRVQPYKAEATYFVSDQESRSTWARLIAQIYEGCAPRSIR